MRSNLIDILHDVVLESDIPAKALAEEIGKPYSTLLREVNPHDAGAKLGAETMFEIIKRTHNVAPLEYMANELGYSLVNTGAGASDVPAVFGVRERSDHPVM